MSAPALFSAAALLCGVVVGLAVNRLARHRTAGAAHPPRWLLLATPVLLGVAGAALTLLPAFAGAVALSQALLLLYVLYALTVVDVLTLTVEPALVLGALLLRLGSVLVLESARAAELLGGALAGAGLLYLVGFAYRWWRGREGLGDGDAAVLALIGAFVGWQGLLPVVLLATAGGIVVGAPLLLAQRRPLDAPLPFAPFLGAAGLVVFVLQAHGWRLFGLLPPLG